MAERIALVGAGVIGRRHLDAMAKTDAAELVAIVDPRPDAAAEAAARGVPFFTDLDEMLREVAPAGVIVATPTEAHFAAAAAALAAGRHLLIEKPVAATLDEARALVAKAEETGGRVLVGHHRRYYPHVEKARALIESGAIGRVVAVSGQWCVRKHDDYYREDWRRRWQAGPILTNLVHELDYLRHILGPVSAVQAEVSRDVQGFEKEDAAAIILRFASGALGAFALSDQADSPWAWEFATGENAAFPRSGENAIRFAGTEGALDFPNLRLWRSDGDAPSWLAPKRAEEFPMDLGDAFIRQIDHFADVIAGRAAPKVSASDAAATLEATLAVLEAGRTGARVTL